MNQPWIYMFSPSWSPLPPPSESPVYSQVIHVPGQALKQTYPGPAASVAGTPAVSLPCETSVPPAPSWAVSGSPELGAEGAEKSRPRRSTHGTALWSFVCSVPKQYLTLCDLIDCSTPGFPVLPHPLELVQTQVHEVGDAIQPSCPLSSLSPPALNLSQHQGLFQWAGSSNQVAKVLELQLRHQSFQCNQVWFPLRLTGLISLQSKGLSRVFSTTSGLGSFQMLTLSLRSTFGRLLGDPQHHSVPAPLKRSALPLSCCLQPLGFCMPPHKSSLILWESPKWKLSSTGSSPRRPHFFFIFFFSDLLLFLILCGLLSSPTRDRACCALHWKHGVLTTGLPGKSQEGLILLLTWVLHVL